jgi:predicted nucleotidyltransferase
MDRDAVITSLQNYKALLSQHFSIQEMYLFGSYAKGNYHDDSDIDVAVVVDHLEGGYLDYTPKLWKLRRSIDIRIEPILFEQGKDPSGFLETIRLNGIRV